MFKITDPAKTLERIYERLAADEALMAEAEANGLSSMVNVYRRSIAARKAAATRVARMLENCS